MKTMGMGLIVVALFACSEQAQPTEATQKLATHKTDVPPATKPEPPAKVQPPTREELAKEFDLELAELEEPETLRSAKKTPACLPVYPRKDVRVLDVDKYRIDVTSAFEGEGKLAFKIGTRVLHEEAFDPENFKTVGDVPAAVMMELKAGKAVTWGFYPNKGRAVTATFNVVKDSTRLKTRIEKVEARTGGGFLAREMTAQLYLNARLYYAAWKEAQEAARMVGEGADECYAIMQASLRRMKLTKSVLWKDIETLVKTKSRRWGRALIRGGGVRR